MMFDRNRVGVGSEPQLSGRSGVCAAVVHCVKGVVGQFTTQVLREICIWAVETCLAGDSPRCGRTRC